MRLPSYKMTSLVACSTILNEFAAQSNMFSLHSNSGCLLLQDSYEFYDGFLILHGTDTLSYTASALSFMLENLGKTVIITGSQIPIFETRTDGKDNFTSGLILAGNYVIPGELITIYIHITKLCTSIHT